MELARNRRARLALPLAVLMALSLGGTTAAVLHARGRPWRTFRVGPGTIDSLRLFDRGFAVGRGNRGMGMTWSFHSIEAGNLIREVEDPLALEPLSGRALLRNPEGALEILDPFTGATRPLPRFHAPGLQGAALSPAEDLVAFVASDVIEVRSATDGALVRAIPFESPDRHSHPGALAFSARGDALAAERISPSWFSLVSIWDLPDGRRRADIEGWLQGFTPSGEVVTADRGQHGLRAMDRKGHARVVAFGSDWGVTLSGSGERVGLLACEQPDPDASVKLTFVVNAADVTTLPGTKGLLRIEQTGAPWERRIALSPDGDRLAVSRNTKGNSEGTIEIWEIPR